MATKNLNIALVIDAVGNAAREIKKIKGEVDKASTATTKLKRKFQEARVAAKSIASTVKSTFATVAKVYAGAGVFSKFAEDYDQVIAKVSTMTKKSFEDVRDTWGESIKKIAKDTGTSLKDLGDGFFEGLSRQVKESEIVGFVKSANKAAIAGGTTVKTIIASVKPILNSYKKDGMDITKVTDMMFASFEKGAFQIEELADAQAQIADKAAQMNIPYREVLGTFAALTQQLGRGSASQVATMMEAFISSFSKQGGERLVQMNKQLKAAGKSTIDFTTDIIKQKGLRGAVQHLDKSLKNAGFSGAEYDKVLRQILGRKEAEKFFLKMTTQMKAAGEATDYIGKSTGLMGKNFKKQMKARDLKKIKIEFQLLAIELGRELLPAFKAITKAVIPIIKNLIKWAKNNPELVSGILAVSTAIYAVKQALSITKPLLMLFGVGSPVLLGVAALATLVAVLGGKFKFVQKMIDGVMHRIFKLLGISKDPEKHKERLATETGLESGALGPDKKQVDAAFKMGEKLRAKKSGKKWVKVGGGEIEVATDNAAQIAALNTAKDIIPKGAIRSGGSQYDELIAAGKSPLEARAMVQQGMKGGSVAVYDAQTKNITIQNTYHVNGDGSTPAQIQKAGTQGTVDGLKQAEKMDKDVKRAKKRAGRD